MNDICGFRWRETPQSREPATDGSYVWRTCGLPKDHTNPVDHHELGLCFRCGPAGPKQKISMDMICGECRSCGHNCSGARLSNPCEHDPEALTKEYKTQSARDAQAMRYGNRSYWDYLDQSAQETHDRYMADGNAEQAELMLTRSLSQALMGNDGD